MRGQGDEPEGIDYFDLSNVPIPGIVDGTWWPSARSCQQERPRSKTSECSSTTRSGRRGSRANHPPAERRRDRRLQQAPGLPVTRSMTCSLVGYAAGADQSSMGGELDLRSPLTRRAPRPGGQRKGEKKAPPETTTRVRLQDLPLIITIVHATNQRLVSPFHLRLPPFSRRRAPATSTPPHDATISPRHEPLSPRYDGFLGALPGPSNERVTRPTRHKLAPVRVVISRACVEGASDAIHGSCAMLPQVVRSGMHCRAHGGVRREGHRGGRRSEPGNGDGREREHGASRMARCVGPYGGGRIVERRRARLRGVE